MFFFLFTCGLHFTFSRSHTLGVFIKRISSYFPNEPFIIKNKVGSFEVAYFNDTIFTSSEYYEQSLEKWLGRSQHKQIFLDLGANIGRYTILALKKYHFEKALSVEANPYTFGILSTNIKLNSIEKKAILCPTAIGNAAGTVKFQVDRHHLGGGSVVSEYIDNPIPYVQVEVPMITVDQVLVQQVVIPSHVDFVKIDVESFTYQVLQGMESLLKSMQIGSCIMIEVGKDDAEVVAVLKQNNFYIVEQDVRDTLFQKRK